MQSSQDGSSAETGVVLRPYETLQTWRGINNNRIDRSKARWRLRVDGLRKFENRDTIGRWTASKACAKMVPKFQLINKSIKSVN